MQATLEESLALASALLGEFEKLARKSSEAYMRVLKGPVDEHHHKIEEAKSALEEASSS